MMGGMPGMSGMNPMRMMSGPMRMLSMGMRGSRMIQPDPDNPTSYKSIFANMTMASNMGPMVLMAFIPVFLLFIFVVPYVAVWYVLKFVLYIFPRDIIRTIRNVRNGGLLYGLNRCEIQRKGKKDTYSELAKIDPSLASRHLHDKLRRAENARRNALNSL